MLDSNTVETLQGLATTMTRRNQTITLQDGRKLNIFKGDGRITIKRGCPLCGGGLLINNGSDQGICVWYSKQFHLSHDFVVEVRSKLN